MIKGVLIGSPASGCGKTTAALGLIAALRARGIPVKAAKAGPDFIDAAWLAEASGSPAINLDSWMLPSGSRLLALAENFAKSSFLVVEGAMGLFDGGEEGNGSSAQLAKILGLPVLLLLNCRGMGQSIAALAHGYMDYPPDPAQRPEICGIICAHAGGVRHRKLLSEALAGVRTGDTKLVGFLPRDGAPRICSRHLGLQQACETFFDAAAAAGWFAHNCDVDGILAKSGWKEPFAAQQEQTKAAWQDGPVIAIARDEAFGFCYADLPGLLAQFGARISFFSPLADPEPPHCDGVYLPGGYPELHAARLSANTGMINGLRKLAARGIPVYGECGGYMYLMRRVTDSAGKSWPMVSLLPGCCRMGKSHAALGYRKVNPVWLCGEELRGHEFHYCELTDNGDDCAPLWRVQDSSGKDLGLQGARRGNVAGSWVHLYPQASKSFWRGWLNLCAQRKHFD